MLKLRVQLPVFFHQLELFDSGQLFDGIFPAKGAGLVRKTLLINQGNRQMAASVFGSCAGLMLLEPLFYICGNAGIQGAVAAGEHIDVIHEIPQKKRAGNRSGAFLCC